MKGAKTPIGFIVFTTNLERMADVRMMIVKVNDPNCIYVRFDI